MGRRIRDILLEARKALEEKGIEDAVISSELFLMHVLGRDRTFLYTHLDDVVEDGVEKEVRRLVERRISREPVAYILGWREFFSRRFLVEKGVLIPRPETETLVEAFLEDGRGGKVVDFGCGSGVVGITIYLEMPGVELFMVDKSRKALQVSKRNAEIHSVKAHFILSQGLSMFKPSSLDHIVSNPPYVREKDLDTLDPEITLYEPLDSYFGGRDGLDVYRIIEKDAWEVLKRGGRIYLEIGFGMAEEVVDLFRRYRFIKTKRDLSGIERVLVFEKP